MRYFLFWVILVTSGLAIGMGISAGIGLLACLVGPLGAIPMALVYFVVLIKIPEAVDWLSDKMGIE